MVYMQLLILYLFCPNEILHLSCEHCQFKANSDLNMKIPNAIHARISIKQKKWGHQI